MNEIETEFPKLDYKLEESYKKLRTNLQFCGSNVKLVNITSCIQGEGKTTVALLLGQSLAESGKSVLVIDADMRKSSLEDMLKIHTQGHKIEGLSHLLSGQAKLDDVLCQSSNIPGLYLIFSGIYPPNPSELLGNSKFNTLLENARKAFDYVIVDTPPLGVVIDSAIVAPKCDGSILVVEYDAISREFASDVMEQLKRTGCQILGVILNKVDNQRSYEYEQRYYGKYSEDSRK